YPRRRSQVQPRYNRRVEAEQEGSICLAVALANTASNAHGFQMASEPTTPTLTCSAYREASTTRCIAGYSARSDRRRRGASLSQLSVLSEPRMIPRGGRLHATVGYLNGNKGLGA